jgi:hypothetical protein
MPTSGFSVQSGTVEGWVRMSSFPVSADSVSYVFAHRVYQPKSHRVYLQLHQDQTWGAGMGDTLSLTTGSALGLDTWHHLVLTYDGATVSGYLDGELDFGPTVYAGLSTLGEIYVMSFSATEDLADGSLDELRVSNVARDPCWVQTTYDSHQAPGDVGIPGFYSVGEEEAL